MKQDEKYDVILKRRNPSIAKRDTINKLLQDSYKSGISYTENNHLHKHSRENNEDYEKRKERSYFISHTKEIVDILIGYLFNYEIKREIPEEIKYIEDFITPDQSYNSFVKRTAIMSCLFTNAVLVDGPSFNPEEAKSEADKENLGLRPYAKRYSIFKIRDFSFDEKAQLEWILLDDTYIDNSDAFSNPKKIILYSLWEKNTVTKIYYKQDPKNKEKIVFSHEEKIEHNLGEVPVVLIAFRDVEDDKFSDSFSENLALLDKAIYNYFSLLDNTLAINAIKPLMFPSLNNKLPALLAEAGKLNEMVAIPFDSNSGNKPFLLEPTNNDSSGYIEIINILLEESRTSVGLTKNGTLHGLSGNAKAKELERMHVIISQGADNLERMENEIIRLFLKWESQENLEYNVEYPDKFIAEETEVILQRMYDSLTIDSETLQRESIKRITEIVHPNMDQKEVDKVVNEVDYEEVEEVEPVEEVEIVENI